MVLHQKHQHRARVRYVPCHECFPSGPVLRVSGVCVSAVVLYGISTVYLAGVMVRLMLTLTPVVCVLSAVCFSSVFERYMSDELKQDDPPAEDATDDDDRRNSGSLYDKVRPEPVRICRRSLIHHRTNIHADSASF